MQMNVSRQLSIELNKQDNKFENDKKMQEEKEEVTTNKL